MPIASHIPAGYALVGRKVHMPKTTRTRPVPRTRPPAPPQGKPPAIHEEWEPVGYGYQGHEIHRRQYRGHGTYFIMGERRPGGGWRWKTMSFYKAGNSKKMATKWWKGGEANVETAHRHAAYHIARK